MDRLAKLTVPRTTARSRSGAAMAAALFAITAAAILTASVHWMTRADIRTTSNRESAVRAMAIAEAGLAHALALVKDTLGDTTMTRLLRGWDGNRFTTADNGRLVGYNLPTATQIPATGRAMPGGTYFVRLEDDPAEVDNDPLTDRNTRLLAICTGVTTDGARAEVNAIIGNASMAGVSIKGDVMVSGTTRVTGRCGSVHSNEDLTVSGAVTVEAGASATGIMNVTGNVSNTYGEALTAQSGAAPAEFPNITAAGYCDRADYEILSNNMILIRSTGLQVPLATLGWTGTSPLFEATMAVTSGTYCVNGNVKMSQPVGSSDARRKVSFIVKGAVEISGNPWVEPEDAQGIMIIADGDLKLNGNAVIAVDNFQGFLYAGGHCAISGFVRITGQVVCANNPDPVGAIDHVDANTISGTTTINYPCRGFLSQLWRVIAWYPTVGA